MPPRFIFNIDATSSVNAPYGNIAKLSSPLHLVDCWNELQAAHKFFKNSGLSNNAWLSFQYALIKPFSVNPKP
jgi:hypothetical protein